MKSFITICLLVASSFNSVFAQDSKFSFPEVKEDDSAIGILLKNAQFEKAEEQINKAITAAKKKKQNVDALEEQLERCERGLLALRGTDKVCILDSIVLPKASFLKAYRAASELGKITLAADGKSTEYTTDRGDRTYRVENKGGKNELVSYFIEDGKLTNRMKVEGLEVDGDLNYPFLMPDGTTFYFSARSEEGLGNYDIYVTRYDAESNKFYRADNIGFPYNSYANDYLMVIDESNGVGWFASDRYQPKDKVCIYTFIPNASRHPFDYESEDEDKIVSAATLRQIKKTWDKSNEQARIKAKQALALMEAAGNEAKPKDFTLVINDNKTYHYYTDFTSAEAKAMCATWQKKQKELDAVTQKLESLRNEYAGGNTAKKQSLKAQILHLEQQQQSLAKETHEAEKQTRNLELK